jgi:hypothetical protein
LLYKLNRSKVLRARALLLEQFYKAKKKKEFLLIFEKYKDTHMQNKNIQSSNFSTLVHFFFFLNKISLYSRQNLHSLKI